jgi:hypothetical protein
VLISTVCISIISANDTFATLSATHRYALGYQMGCTDGPDQENYIATGGFHKHSPDFTKGYNQSFAHGCKHDDPALQREVDTIIAKHLNA